MMGLLYHKCLSADENLTYLPNDLGMNVVLWCHAFTCKNLITHQKKKETCIYTRVAMGQILNLIREKHHYLSTFLFKNVYKIMEWQ